MYTLITANFHPPRIEDKKINLFFADCHPPKKGGKVQKVVLMCFYAKGDF